MNQDAKRKVRAIERLKRDFDIVKLMSSVRENSQIQTILLTPQQRVLMRMQDKFVVRSSDSDKTEVQISNF
jgi:hypothetical protein